MKLFIILTAFAFLTPSSSLKEIRVAFKQAHQSTEKANSFYEMASKTADKSDLNTAYFGASKAILAKFKGNPMSKLQYFKAGAKNIESAVKSAPNNSEIRFIRLSIQYNAPSLLSYSENIEEDKSYILTHFKTESSKTQRVLLDYKEGSTFFTKSELQQLKK